MKSYYEHKGEMHELDMINPGPTHSLIYCCESGKTFRIENSLIIRKRIPKHSAERTKSGKIDVSAHCINQCGEKTVHWSGKCKECRKIQCHAEGCTNKFSSYKQMSYCKRHLHLLNA